MPDEHEDICQFCRDHDHWVSRLGLIQQRQEMVLKTLRGELGTDYEGIISITKTSKQRIERLEADVKMTIPKIERIDATLPMIRASLANIEAHHRKEAADEAEISREKRAWARTLAPFVLKAAVTLVVLWFMINQHVTGGQMQKAINDTEQILKANNKLLDTLAFSAPEPGSGEGETP
jgi:hypothetical protein